MVAVNSSVVHVASSAVESPNKKRRKFTSAIEDVTEIIISTHIAPSLDASAGLSGCFAPVPIQPLSNHLCRSIHYLSRSIHYAPNICAQFQTFIPWARENCLARKSKSPPRNPKKCAFLHCSVCQRAHTSVLALFSATTLETSYKTTPSHSCHWGDIAWM